MSDRSVGEAYVYVHMRFRTLTTALKSLQSLVRAVVVNAHAAALDTSSCVAGCGINEDVMRTRLQSASLKPAHRCWDCETSRRSAVIVACVSCQWFSCCCRFDSPGMTRFTIR